MIKSITEATQDIIGARPSCSLARCVTSAVARLTCATIEFGLTLKAKQMTRANHSSYASFIGGAFVSRISNPPGTNFACRRAAVSPDSIASQ